MGFNINISRNLEPYDKQFGGKVTFYKDVKFEKSITISGDLVVNGNITAAGSSGLTAENLKGGEQGSIPYQDGVNSTTFLPPTNAAGRFLKSNGPGQDPEWVAIGGGQGALDLDSLQDVDNDVANATNGQIIRYNSSTSKWERFTPNYLTAETSHADVVIDGDFTSEGLMKRGSSAGTYSIVTDNSSNWNTAFSWGNHASVGYIEDSDFSSNGFMKRTGAGTYTVDGSTYISNINNEDLGDLSNVNVPASPTFGHILKWTGSAWTAEADAGGSAGAGVDGAPAGTVSMWSGTASSVPNGYLLCDGSAVSRVAYTDLFNAIGTAHGAGDGSTTFNLPNLRNRFVVGEGTSYALAATGGSADATLVSHSHTVDSHSHSDGTLSVDNHTHNFSGNFNGNTDTNTHSHVFPGDDQLTFANNLANWNNRSAGAYSYDANSSTSGGGQMWLTSDNSHSHNVSGSYSGNTGNSGAGVSGNTGSESPGTDSQGSSATNANLPPYYALCYVIKVTSGGAITATDSLTLTSTDAGAAAAPTITLTRDSATPAANDIIGQIDFRGEDDASNSDSFAKIQGKITDPTSGSEDGTLEVVVKTGGNDQTIAFPTTSGTLALTSQLASAFPSGGIIMWSGAEGDIPNGWLLCNGQGSTPDLRNRFVVGAGTGSSYSVNDTGGSNDATLVSHSHGSGNYGTNNTGGHSHGTNNSFNVMYLDPLKGFCTGWELLNENFLTTFCEVHMLFLSTVSSTQIDVMDP
jgi:microcystin-dependent protein